MQAPFREVGPVAGKHFSEDHTVGISLVRPNHDQYNPITTNMPVKWAGE